MIDFKEPAIVLEHRIKQLNRMHQRAVDLILELSDEPPRKVLADLYEMEITTKADVVRRLGLQPGEFHELRSRDGET